MNCYLCSDMKDGVVSKLDFIQNEREAKITQILKKE